MEDSEEPLTGVEKKEDFSTNLQNKLPHEIEMSETYKSLSFVNLDTGKERTEVFNKIYVTLAADYFEYFTQLGYKKMRVNK